MRDRWTNLAVWAISTAALVWADQWTKMLAVSHLKGQEPYVIWDGVFELLYSENRGAAFGMLQGRQTMFYIIAALVVAAAAYVMWRMPGWKQRRYHWLRFCAVLITAGAVGNLIDRVSQQYVVDFLYFKLIDFPIFNVADIYVTVGSALVFLAVCFYYREGELAVFGWKKEAGA